MGRTNSYITITDQFCGAGGSSQGAENAGKKIGGGVEVKLALNHWKLAIETHNTNFPTTLHDCTDISASDPRRYPSTTILITSPECTNHSLAKGQKIVKKQMDLFASGKLDPAAERSRATMWDVPRFAEYHRYEAVIVENVVDARKWVMFDSWLHAMHSLGYMHRCVYMNSMHAHPTPQSRDRMYVVFWKKGNRAPVLDFMPNAHCPKCGKDVAGVQTWKRPDVRFGKYRQQYVYCCPVDGVVVEPYYYASFNCIDWSDPGRRIGDREKPLSPNTMKRIQYGLDRYGKAPYILHAAYGKEARGVVRPLTAPTFTQTTFASQAVVQPFIINDQQSTGIGHRVRGVSEVIPTVSTQPHFKMIFPFVIKEEHSKNDSNARSTSQPFQTQTTRQSMALVSQGSLLIENKGTSSAKPVTSPAGCVTTVPYLGLLTTEAWQSFLSSYYNGSNCLQHFTDPAGTVTTNDRAALVSFKAPSVEDCYYRMLKAHEIKLAMAFGQNYVVLGSSKDQVKQLGNAVTPPAMEWLVGQVIESLN